MLSLPMPESAGSVASRLWEVDRVNPEPVPTLLAMISEADRRLHQPPASPLRWTAGGQTPLDGATPSGMVQPDSSILIRQNVTRWHHAAPGNMIALGLVMRRSRVRPEGLVGRPGLVHDHVRAAALQVRVMASPLRSMSAKAVTCRTTSVKRSG